MIKEGDTVYTVLRRISQTGKTKYYDIFLIEDDKPVHLLDKLSAEQNDKLGNLTYNPSERGFFLRGTTNNGKDLVETISIRLFGDSEAIKRGGF